MSAFGLPPFPLRVRKSYMYGPQVVISDHNRVRLSELAIRGKRKSGGGTHATCRSRSSAKPYANKAAYLYARMPTKRPIKVWKTVDATLLLTTDSLKLARA